MKDDIADDLTNLWGHFR